MKQPGGGYFDYELTHKSFIWYVCIEWFGEQRKTKLYARSNPYAYGEFGAIPWY